MNYTNLEKNLIDVIKESQIKIGYTPNPVELYYPCQALNNLLDTNLDKNQLADALKNFSSEKIGEISISADDEIFCIKIPVQGVKYVHENVPDNPFLMEFINFVRNTHYATIDSIKEIFLKYSQKVVCQKIENSDEFDYLLYFEDGIPDDYRYCISIDLGHIIYHRFTPKDYSQFFLPPPPSFSNGQSDCV